MISGVVGFEPTTKILEIPIITNLTTLLYYKIKFNLYLYTNYYFILLPGPEAPSGGPCYFKL